MCFNDTLTNGSYRTVNSSALSISDRNEFSRTHQILPDRLPEPDDAVEDLVQSGHTVIGV